MLRNRVARGVLAAGCTLAVAALGAGTAAAAERAFELVTPADSLEEAETNGGFTTADGRLVTFASGGSIAGAEPNGPYPTQDSYTARLTTSGWTTEWTTDSTDEPGTFGSRTLFSTPDGLRQIMQTENSIDPGDTFAHSMDPYLRERGEDGGRTLTWLTPGPRPNTEGRYALAATPDLRKVLVTTTRAMVSEDINDFADVYLLTDGVPRLVTPGRDPNVTNVAVIGNVAVPGTLGDDGSYVYFPTSARLSAEDVDAEADVYRWNAEGGYELISVNRRTAAPSADAPATLLAASKDGDVVCFSTATALVDGDDDDADDVYCYTRSTDTLDWASSGDNPAMGLGATALGMSEDGRSVFFSTLVSLTPDDVNFGLSLYVRRGGATTYVSELSFSDVSEYRRVATEAQGERALHITADGTALVFTTGAQAVRTTDTDNAPDVYRWTVDDGLEHVSVGDEPGDAFSGAAPSSPDLVLSAEAVIGRVMNGDGSVVFFESTAGLVPQDTDGGFNDVYEWRSDGSLRLVSPEGDGRYDALYLDSSADGRTVFIVTAEPVLPQDVNAVRDVYAARVGGGFTTPPVVSPCVSDACQGVPPALPSLPPTGSSGFAGPSDVDERSPVEARQRLLSLTTAQRRALARRGRTVVRVTVSAPGIVALTASARIGRRTTQVGRAWIRATRRGTVRIPISLSKAARAELRRRRSLRVTFTSTYSKSDEPVRRAVTLRG